MMNMRFSMIVALSVMTLSALLLTSCEDGDGNPTNPMPTARIVGVVVAMPNNTPVAGAQISTEPVTQTVLTAADGSYEIKGVPNGTYIVRATHGQFGQGTASVSVTSGQTGRADIALRGDNNNGGGDDDSTGDDDDDSTGGPGDPNPMPGVIAHFPLDGNAFDVSNHLPTGRISGAMPTANRRGEAGKAMRFDGQNDFIEVDVFSHPRLKQFPLTWSIWVRHEGMPKNEWPVGLYLHPSGDGLGFFYENGKWGNFYSANAFNNYCRHNGTLPADGRWHHVAFTIDASGMTTYVDGERSGFIGWAGKPAMANTDAPLRFGIIPSVHPTMPPNPWRGDVDDFMAFDRVLSPQEIRQLAR